MRLRVWTVSVVSATACTSFKCKVSVRMLQLCIHTSSCPTSNPFPVYFSFVVFPTIRCCLRRPRHSVATAASSHVRRLTLWLPSPTADQSRKRFATPLIPDLPAVLMCELMGTPPVSGFLDDTVSISDGWCCHLGGIKKVAVVSKCQVFSGHFDGDTEKTHET